MAASNSQYKSARQFAKFARSLLQALGAVQVALPLGIQLHNWLSARELDFLNSLPTIVTGIIIIGLTEAFYQLVILQFDIADNTAQICRLLENNNSTPPPAKPA